MRKLKLPPFENVGANQVAVMPRIPMGETYHGIILKLGGTTFTKSLIAQIKIRLGGKVIWDLTGSQLDVIDLFMGQTANAAYLLIPFSDFNARTTYGESIGAIDTSLPYSGFAMEVSIGAATAPTLEAWSLTTKEKVVQEAWQRPLFRCMVPATHSIGAAGGFNLPIPLGSDSGAFIKRIHNFHANITEFSVKMNGSDIQDQGENGVIQFFQNNLTRVTQAGHLAFDPTVLDNQANAIPTVRSIENGLKRRNNFEFKATLSGADTIVTVSELYADIESV
jgi:hypothetical protein